MTNVGELLDLKDEDKLLKSISVGKKALEHAIMGNFSSEEIDALEFKRKEIEDAFKEAGFLEGAEIEVGSTHAFIRLRDPLSSREDYSSLLKMVEPYLFKPRAYIKGTVQGINLVATEDYGLRICAELQSTEFSNWENVLDLREGQTFFVPSHGKHSYFISDTVGINA